MLTRLSPSVSLVFLPRSGLPYPSSAQFTREVWPGPVSLTLCEKDEYVAKEIGGWLALPEVALVFRHRELHQGDWRDRFRKGFGSVEATGALFVEMDPMRFEHHDAPQGRDDRATMFPEDLPIVVTAVAALGIPVVVQVSSFSANNDNPHRVIEPAITRGLAQGGFTLAARIEANGNMISLVYSRGVQLWEGTDGSQGRKFTEWLSKI